MQWPNIILWSVALMAAIWLLITAAVRRERTLVEVLRDLVTRSLTPAEANPAPSQTQNPTSPAGPAADASDAPTGPPAATQNKNAS